MRDSREVELILFYFSIFLVKPLVPLFSLVLLGLLYSLSFSHRMRTMNIVQNRHPDNIEGATSNRHFSELSMS